MCRKILIPLVVADLAEICTKGLDMDIKVNERGLRVGESHPRAVLSDHEVELMLELREDGYSYGWLAKKFEVHKQTVAKICQGVRRGQLAFRRTRAAGAGR